MLKVFISYAHEDALYLDELHTHLAPLRGSLIETWTDRDIRAGTPWEAEIWSALAVSSIVIVLVSADFLASEFAARELKAAVERHHAGQTRLIPVIVRECRWKHGPLKDFQVLWPDKPVRSHGAHRHDRDGAWVKVVEEVEKVAMSIPVAALMPDGLAAPPALLSASTVRLGEVKISPLDGLEYVWISPGQFQMGASRGDAEAFEVEKPAHCVTITRGFWLGKTPVTQAAFERVMGTNPSYSKGASLPVENISWDEARAYAVAVGMRLPTEAEWEYAARAGTTGSRYGNLEEIAWFDGNNGERTHDVGAKAPNAFGLYDMLGNVLEWVGDFLGPYSATSTVDPRGPYDGASRVLRGGARSLYSKSVRASFRYTFAPTSRYRCTGFRCAGD